MYTVAAEPPGSRINISLKGINPGRGAEEGGTSSQIRIGTPSPPPRTSLRKNAVSLNYVEIRPVLALEEDTADIVTAALL